MSVNNAKYFKIPAAVLSILFCLFLSNASAQTVSYNAPALLPHVEISFSPRTGSFVEGSTFQVPIYLNTKNRSINGIEVRVNYDKNKLSIINPTGGTSIIGVWVEPPSFDNSKGNASYVGVVPDGITTGAGLIGTVTFKVIATGKATISLGSNSKILLNDGLGTPTIVDFAPAQYELLTKAPDGVQIFSETHPIQDNWYNNKNPIFSWIREPGVTSFSYILDNEPQTVPDDTVDSTDTTTHFEKLADGLYYFHVKALKKNVWGMPGHFLVRIDTTPPAEFTPQANYLLASALFIQRTLVSFFTTDNLSGIDHYEVGIIDKTQPTTQSPLFVESTSPFQVPISSNSDLQVVVRAIDKAGNVRDESVNVKEPFAIVNYIKNNLVYILLGIILLGLLGLIVHYLFGHHIIRNLRRLSKMVRQEEAAEAAEEPLPPL